MNINPLNDLVVMRPLKPEDPRSPGGIILPMAEEAQQTPHMGLVLAVGPGKRARLSPAAKKLVGVVRGALTFQNIQNYSRELVAAALAEHDDAAAVIPMTVKPGDKVIYSRHGYQEFRVDGLDVVVCGEASIIGIVDE